MAETPVFLSVDESEVRDFKYSNVLIGKVAQAEILYLVNCSPLQCPANKEIICQIVADKIKVFDINRKNLLHLIADAVRYNTAAEKTLKVFIHACFTLHALHICYTMQL